MDEKLDADERTRKEAIARSLCARLCDERLSLEGLTAFDASLRFIEGEFERRPIEQVDLALLRDRFNPDEPGISETERAKRTGWNLAMRHALSLVRAFRGLDEMRRSSQWPDESKLAGDLDAMRQMERAE